MKKKKILTVLVVVGVLLFVFICIDICNNFVKEMAYKDKDYIGDRLGAIATALLFIFVVLFYNITTLNKKNRSIYNACQYVGECFWFEKHLKQIQSEISQLLEKEQDETRVETLKKLDENLNYIRYRFFPNNHDFVSPSTIVSKMTIYDSRKKASELFDLQLTTYYKDKFNLDDDLHRLCNNTAWCITLLYTLKCVLLSNITFLHPLSYYPFYEYEKDLHNIISMVLEENEYDDSKRRELMFFELHNEWLC